MHKEVKNRSSVMSILIAVLVYSSFCNSTVFGAAVVDSITVTEVNLYAGESSIFKIGGKNLRGLEEIPVMKNGRISTDLTLKTRAKGNSATIKVTASSSAKGTYILEFPVGKKARTLPVHVTEKAKSRLKGAKLSGDSELIEDPDRRPPQNGSFGGKISVHDESMKEKMKYGTGSSALEGGNLVKDIDAMKGDRLSRLNKELSPNRMGRDINKDRDTTIDRTDKLKGKGPGASWMPDTSGRPPSSGARDQAMDEWNQGPQSKVRGGTHGNPLVSTTPAWWVPVIMAATAIVNDPEIFDKFLGDSDADKFDKIWNIMKQNKNLPDATLEDTDDSMEINVQGKDGVHHVKKDKRTGEVTEKFIKYVKVDDTKDGQKPTERQLPPGEEGAGSSGFDEHKEDAEAGALINPTDDPNSIPLIGGGNRLKLKGEQRRYAPGEAPRKEPKISGDELKKKRWQKTIGNLIQPTPEGGDGIDIGGGDVDPDDAPSPVPGVNNNTPRASDIKLGGDSGLEAAGDDNEDVR